MNRTEISNSGILTSDFYGIVFGLGIIAGISILNWGDSSSVIIVSSTALMVIAFWFYGRFKTISFDDSKIYFKRGRQNLEISLFDVKEVRVNKWIPIDQDSQPYSIIYTGLNGQIGKVRFIPFKNSPKFDRFIRTLKTNNNNVKILID